MGNFKKLHKTAAACTPPVQVLKAIISWLLNWQQHLADLVLLQSGAGSIGKATVHSFTKKILFFIIQGNINRWNVTELQRDSQIAAVHKSR